MRVGLIGAGGIAAAHLDAWQALGAEVLLTSRTRPVALAERFGVEIVDDADTLIERVDVVGILSPTPTHPELALGAIARGRHVVCEKPLAVSAIDAQRIADAAASAGVRLFPAHVVRYFDAYRRIKDDVDAGAVGRVQALRLTRTGSGPSTPWFYDEHAGGGLIRDLLIHDIDQALWIAGPVATVSARQDPPSLDGRFAAPVTARVELTHIGGAATVIEGGWLGGDTPFRTTIEVDGTSGTRRHDSADTSTSSKGGYLPPPSDDAPYRAQIADFAHAIRTGSPARVTPADGVAAVVVVDAAYASIAAGGSAIALPDPAGRRGHGLGS